MTRQTNAATATVTGTHHQDVLTRLVGLLLSIRAANTAFIFGPNMIFTLYGHVLDLLMAIVDVDGVQ